MIINNKKKYVLILMASAAIICLSILWYVNKLILQIEKEERQKIALWSSAISNKAYMLRFTNQLFTDLAIEERTKVELWAKAVKTLSESESDDNLGFLLDMIKNNSTVPVILIDEDTNYINCRNYSNDEIIKFSTDKAYLKKEIKDKSKYREPIESNFYLNRKNYIYYKDSKTFNRLKDFLDNMLNELVSEIVENSVSVPVILTENNQNNIIAFGNIDSSLITNKEYAVQLINLMEKQNNPIVIDLGNDKKNIIYYSESDTLIYLKYFPYLLFIVLSIFLLFAYWVFSTSKKADQNRVWVGMSKETAHQLGTPLSSLMAWLELLKVKLKDQLIIDGIEKDIKKLEIVTDRFSKIGSVPNLEKVELITIIKNTKQYIESRSSEKIQILIHENDKNFNAYINTSLFEWVLENLFKNAADAMKGDGLLEIEMGEMGKYIYIDISDTGKGIPKANYKDIFNPGFTTKKRGWGLGLSLSKRIIEDYHKGKIFVKDSELNKGTTFRILLKK